MPNYVLASTPRNEMTIPDCRADTPWCLFDRWHASFISAPNRNGKFINQIVGFQAYFDDLLCLFFHKTFDINILNIYLVFYVNVKFCVLKKIMVNTTQDCSQPFGASVSQTRNGRRYEEEGWELPSWLFRSLHRTRLNSFKQRLFTLKCLKHAIVSNAIYVFK